MQRIENFIEVYKLPVYIILTVIILCCLAVTFAIDRSAVPAFAGVNYTVTNEAGGEAICGREEAMEFGRICIDNLCPCRSNSSFHISDSGGVYTVYQDRADTYFDECYKIYPCAVITSEGDIFVTLHRKFIV